MDRAKELDELLAQYEQCAEDRRYFDNLLWQHLWRMFAINGVLLGIAYSEAISISVKAIILVVATLCNYMCTISFSKCYFWLGLLLNALTTLEKDKLKAMYIIPRRTEDIKKDLKQGLRERSVEMKPSLPFQLKSTPRIAFWSMWLFCTFMISLLLYEIFDMIPCLPWGIRWIAIGCAMLIHLAFFIKNECITHGSLIFDATNRFFK